MMYLSLGHVELSPTNVALPSLVAEWLVTTENKAEVQFTPEVWKSPPRDYLNLIQVLLI